MTPFSLQLSPHAYAGHPHGASIRLVDMLILLACQQGANRLEFRTVEDELCIAMIGDTETHDFPPLPETPKNNVLDYLRRICNVTSTGNSGKNVVRIGEAAAILEFHSDSPHYVVVTIVSPFTPRPDYTQLINSLFEPHHAMSSADSVHYNCVQSFLRRTISQCLRIIQFK